MQPATTAAREEEMAQQALSAQAAHEARVMAHFDGLDELIARIHAQMVADGLIRSPEARTRCTDEIDAAADTFAEAGMDDFAAMLRGAL